MPTTTHKTLIINSIGTAKPAVANVLTDVFGVGHEVAVRMLYTAPFVLLHNVEEELANNTAKLLTTLGIEATIQGIDDELPGPQELFDVAVYIEDPIQLPKVVRELSEFIGSDEKQAASLLLNEPGVVLGGVSLATAEALSKRTNAEVIISSPRTDIYAIKINGNDPTLGRQIEAAIVNAGLTVTKDDSGMFENLDYVTSHDIWRRFQSTGQIQIINQSFQRFEIILNLVDTNNPDYKKALTEIVGMPEDIIDTVLANLPVQLDESVNKKTLQDKLVIYNNSGLKCTYHAVRIGNYYLHIDEVHEPQQVLQVLKQCFNDNELPAKPEKWRTPRPVNHLLSRYMSRQLELLGCTVERIHEYEHN